ncbi:MAG: hypothetical protein ACI8VY_001299 [Cellvibrionaceae bacterium]|jgi:hypothetical protein
MHIMHNKIFINRRKGDERREDDDPCKDLDVDLYHRKRRKKIERREDRSLSEDYYAFAPHADANDDKNDKHRH